MNVYEIMPTLWKYVFTFGRKSQENEFNFPGFGQRQTSQRTAGNAAYGQLTALSPEDSYKKDSINILFRICIYATKGRT